MKKLLKNDLKMQLKQLNHAIRKLTPLKKRLPKNSIIMLHLTITRLMKLINREDNSTIRASLKAEFHKANKKLNQLIKKLNSSSETLSSSKK